MRFSYIFLLLLFNSILYAQKVNTNWVFKNHQEGYNLYRIPAVIITNSGKVIAFCEGRKTLFDGGDIDIVMKTSDDHGKSWSALKVIWNDSKNTCGNPSPIYNKITGELLIIACKNNDSVFVLRSKDEGITWQTPYNITTSVKLNNWKWYATGPVHAIQLANSTYKNRIVVPCNHTTDSSDKHISHCIYSDDHGFTWHLGTSVTAINTDECTIAELSDGSLLLNMRNNDRTLPNRKISKSTDGGQTWTHPIYDSFLIEPNCQASLLTYSLVTNCLLFSNPKHISQRKNLTLSISYDNGNTWQKQVFIHSKKSAYSDLCELKTGDILCLFEQGKILPYGGISFSIISKTLINYY